MKSLALLIVSVGLVVGAVGACNSSDGGGSGGEAGGGQAGSASGGSTAGKGGTPNTAGAAGNTTGGSGGVALAGGSSGAAGGSAGTSSMTGGAGAGGSNPNPGAPAVTVKDMTFEGRGSWVITAGKYTFYFEKDKGRSGFYRMIDSTGKDWVQAGLGKGAVTGGVPGEWRGFPNATASNFGHPLRDSKSTTVVKGGVMSSDKIILDSTSPTMHFEYWIFPSHIAIKVLKAAEPYCFLIEATPGGSQNGWFVDAKGVEHTKPLYSDSNQPAAVRSHDASPEWLYFGADSSTDVMFLGKTPDDAFVDENYGRPGDMDIYAFGRLSVSPWTRYIPAGQLEHVGVIGFLPKAGTFETKKAMIEKIMKAPFEVAAP